MDHQMELVTFLENIGTILAKVLCVAQEDICVTLETKLVNGVGEGDIDLASIDYVDFLMCIEEEYNIVYDFDTKIQTIGDVYEYIQNFRKLKGGISTDEA